MGSAEFAYLHDWNVILVEDGKDLQSISRPNEKLQRSRTISRHAIVYKTVKGWNYVSRARRLTGLAMPSAALIFTMP